jgi:voltage-gated potassium channel Kch
LLIDDDCALPPNFPIVSNRLKNRVKCIGYTIKSVGTRSSKGTLCQQAQDLEYKLSGLQRSFAGKIGSATFPHGAISIWNREFLISTFHQHPGYRVSEDWFFGHAARQLGSRIKMCTSVFVETETPNSIFFSSGGSRGGFGEMTVCKQRFLRWNFFFVNGMFYNLDYVFRSWKLGWWEIGAKLFVFQEVYETLLYLLAPFIFPVSLIVRPAFTGYLVASVFGLYLLSTMIFNEIHLRLKNERIGWKAAYVYYNFYKIVLLGVNVVSCYWSLYKYAGYFATRHPKVVEDEKAIEVVLRMEEQTRVMADASLKSGHMTVVAIGSQMRDFNVVESQHGNTQERKMTLLTIGPRLNHGVPPLRRRNTH